MTSAINLRNIRAPVTGSIGGMPPGMENIFEFDIILQLMPVPIFGVEDGIIGYINSCAESKFPEIHKGFPLAALLGRHWEGYSSVCGSEFEVRTIDYRGESYSVTVRKLSSGWDIMVFSPMVKSGNINAEIINAVSSKIREPLSTIFSVTSLLFPKLEELEDEKVARHMAILNKSYYRLLRLSANIADMDKIVDGSASLFIENIGVNALISQFYERVEPLCRTMKIALELKSLPKEVVIAADRQKLERALLNLLSNAIKNCSEKDRITIWLKATKASVLITFRDTGKGISPEKMSKVFLEYGKNTLETGPDGLGLGLIIVQGVASLHGGSVAMESTPGTGTSITISLPNRSANAPDTLRTRVINYDYTGGLSHDLVELSDVLPPELFYSEGIN